MGDGIAIAEDNYVSVFGTLPELVPAGARAGDDGVVHVHTGAPVPTFNPSIVHQLPHDLDRLIDDAEAFHETHASPVWVLAVPGRHLERFAPVAERRGFSATGDEPFMVLDELAPVSLPEGLEVRRAADIDDVRVHFAVLSEAFGLPADVLDGILGPGFVDDRCHMFIGSVDGTPVCTSMLAVSDGAGVRCAGVYNVGTLGTERRRGLGRAMTAHAAEVGREQFGCTVATLQSSPAGYSVYEAMGYREVTRWQFWGRS